VPVLRLTSCRAGSSGVFFSKFPFFAPSHALFDLARAGRCVIIFSLSVDLFSFCPWSFALFGRVLKRSLESRFGCGQQDEKKDKSYKKVIREEEGSP
jgi:hypothetical protein